MQNSLNTLQRALETLDPDAEPRVVVTSWTSRIKPRRLAVLDSSFNPPTYAHRQLIDVASRQFSFDHRLLLLAKSNVDKSVFGAPLPHRLQMMELMAKKMDNTSVAVTAHGRFVDKAKALKRTLGHQTNLYFILGFDTATRLFDPKYYADISASLEEFFSLAEVIYTNRAEYSPDTCRNLKRSQAAAPFQSRLHFVELEKPFARMSSTEARHYFADRNPAVRKLVPSAVREYLRDHAFYGQ